VEDQGKNRKELSTCRLRLVRVPCLSLYRGLARAEAQSVYEQGNHLPYQYGQAQISIHGNAESSSSHVRIRNHEIGDCLFRQV